MKKRNLFLTLGLALGLGVGVAAGLGARGLEAKEVEADKGDLTVVELKGSFNGWGDGISFVKDGNNDWNLTYSLEKDVQFKIHINGVEEGEKWVGYNWSISASNIDYDYIGNDGENFKAKSSQSFVFKVKSTFYTNFGDDVTIKKNLNVTYNVNKYAVVNGVAEAEPFATDVEPENTVYGVPSRANRKGYHFGGWYTTSACNVEFTGATLTGNLDIYAKYTTLVNDRYVYYVTGTESATPNHIYSYGGDSQFGEWPGTAITSVSGTTDVHGVLAFEGVTQKIYKIPYSSTAGDSHIVINYQGGAKPQTGNLPLAHMSAYWFDEADQVKYSADAGTAIEFLLKVENTRNAVSAAGNILDYSICGIAAGTAKSLYEEYDEFSASVKTYINSTKTNTYLGKYDGINVPEEGLVSYSAIMNELGVRGGVIAAGVQFFANHTNTNNSNTALIIVIVSTMSLVAVGIFFAIRRRKEQE